MADQRRRNSFTGSNLPIGTLPTLPGRTGASGNLPVLPKVQDAPSAMHNHFLPALGPSIAAAQAGSVAAATASSLASTNDMLQAMKQKAMERSQAVKQRSKSVPRSAGSSRGDSGRTRQGRPQLPVRRPEKLDPEEITRNLAAKLQPLDAVTSSLLAAVEERKGGTGLPLLKATCKDFVVGRATCAASSVVTLCTDRLEYKFSHNNQGRIDMVMFTKDMQAPELDLKSLVLKFRVGKPLRHFIDAYDCTDPAHHLALTFHEKADATAFGDSLLNTCKVAVQVVNRDGGGGGGGGASGSH
ncbi:hypothetical protein Agub_g8934 [Astrephomene gubernaculifera]|uniref:Uncharacterized protein n=1 Tax=Astrephomene gubernaculifera TaxID=47775 RepID=A0AAD3DSU3_9CHLO|nr:hypothetical protein Agub_g8934 [Astrephomene gubernaculifera]